MTHNTETHFGGQAYLSLAKLPVGNPVSIEEFVRYRRYAITLIEHDYSGKTSTMWNAAYKHFNMPIVMGMMVGNPQKAKEILEEFRRDSKYVGGGVGVGFKDESVEWLDELDSLAEAIGSANLVQKLPSGKLKGWNTDGLGYRKSLENLLAEKGQTLEGAKVVMLGAGGTGNAIAFALAEKGARIVILNRTVEKAAELARRINIFVGSQRASGKSEDAIESEVADATIVINVSTKGATGDLAEYSALAPAKLPATLENISENIRNAEKVLARVPKETILSDVILRSTPSPFLKMANEYGFTTLDGLPMVINQAVEAFMILHGEEIIGASDSRKQLQKIMSEAAR
jgi:shikimate dehydrogenase